MPRHGNRETLPQLGYGPPANAFAVSELLDGT
jgi:hypothetical protein